MSASTIPSGRFATRIGPGGSGDPMRADRWPAPGLPDGRKGGQRAIGVHQADEPGPTNPLLSAGSPPQQPQWANALLHTPSAPPPAAPPQQVAVAPPSPAGQAIAAAHGKYLTGLNMTAGQIAQQAARVDFYREAIGRLARMGKEVTRADVVNALARCATDGDMPSDQVAKALATVPNDSKALAAWCKQHYTTALHLQVQLAVMQQSAPAASAT